MAVEIKKLKALYYQKVQAAGKPSAFNAGVKLLSTCTALPQQPKQQMTHSIMWMMNQTMKMARKMMKKTSMSRIMKNIRIGPRMGLFSPFA